MAPCDWNLDKYHKGWRTEESTSGSAKQLFRVKSREGQVKKELLFALHQSYDPTFLLMGCGCYNNLHG